MRPKPPAGVTLLLWTVLSLSAWGAVRAFAALRWWDVLFEYQSRLSPLYLSLTGAGWGVAGGVLLWAGLTRRKGARPALQAAVLLWLSQYWVERLFFEASRANLLFALILSILFIAGTLICTLHPGTKKYFTGREEHDQPDPHPTPE